MKDIKNHLCVKVRRYLFVLKDRAFPFAQKIRSPSFLPPQHLLGKQTNIALASESPHYLLIKLSLFLKYPPSSSIPIPITLGLRKPDDTHQLSTHSSTAYPTRWIRLALIDTSSMCQCSTSKTPRFSTRRWVSPLIRCSRTKLPTAWFTPQALTLWS